MAYFFRCIRLLSLLAGAVGENADATRYSALSEQIQASLNRQYLHENGGAVFYDNGSQSADAHGLFFNICPPDRRERLTEHLVHSIRERDASTSGFMGTMCLLQALSRNGKSDLAYALLKNPNLGGWVYLLEHCRATTFPERYNGEGSQNHAFLGSAPGLWVYKYLVGISPLEPGYRQVQIMPCFPGDLTFAEATVETPYGPVSAAWERTEGRIRLRVSFPPNVTGVVEFDGLRRSLHSGTYEFSSRP